jgi:hypothetical protein
MQDSVTRVIGVNATADLCIPVFPLADDDVSSRMRREGHATRERRARGTATREECRVRRQDRGVAAGRAGGSVVEERDVFGCKFGCGFSSVSFKV